MDAAQSAARLTCPACGTLQDSPGSTNCEVCGADLYRPQPPAPSPSTSTSTSAAVDRTAALRRAAAAMGAAVGTAARTAVGVPVRLVRRVVAGIAAALLGVLALILRLVTFTLRMLLILAVVAAIVLGLTYIPAVQARVPAAKDLPGMAWDLVRDGADRGVWWARGMLRSNDAPPEARPADPAPAPRAVSPPPVRRPPSRPAAQPAARPAPATRTTAPRPAAATARPSLNVASTPEGATVLVNQRRVGRTPLTLTLAPGTYTVTVSRPGYRSVTRRVTVRAGTASISVTLTMAP